MLDSILNLIKGNQREAQPSHTIEVAAAALMAEIMRADNTVESAELASMQSQLQQQFNLTAEELEAVSNDGQVQSESAVDLVQFTQTLNANMSDENKEKVLQALWHVAYADQTLSPDEEHLIRKIADLLYIPHNRFIKTKLQAQSA